MYATERVKLTSVRKSDLPALFKWINDPELVHFNSPFRPVDELSHREWFERVRRSKGTVLFAIRKTADDKLIGTCQLHSIDSTHKHAELQIRIGDGGEQSKGYGTDAVGLLLRHGFRELNLHKIHLHVFADNLRAIRTYETAGFAREGLLRKHFFVNGEYRDVCLMGILNAEFRK